MSRTKLAVALALCVMWAVPARAQGFIAPYIGFPYGGDVSSFCASLTNCEERRMNWGVEIGSARGAIGFAEDIGYAKNFFGDVPGSDNSVLTLMTNLMVVLPAGPIRLYGLFGFGLVHPHVSFGTSAFDLSKNAIGYDFGGGVNIMFTHGFGIRGDIRDIRTFQDLTLGIFDSQKLNFWRGSAGLVFQF